MALEPAASRDPLARAVDAARREPFESTPAGWVQLSDSIMTRVRGVVRPAEPLVVHSSGGLVEQDEHGSRTYVSARVVNDALRRVLQQHPTHAPDHIDLITEDHRLSGVRVGLVAAYGTALLPLAERVREEVREVIVELLGPDPDVDRPHVDVEFTDVVAGDPYAG